MFGAIGALHRLDVAVLHTLTAYHSPLLDAVMLAMSTVGRGGFVWFALALIGWLVRRHTWPILIQTIVAICLASLVADVVLKPLVHRPRPFQEEPAMRVIGSKPDSGSFPSGHSANALAGAFVLTRAFPWAAVVLWALAALMGLSRIYLGVHYPADVMGGAAIGLICGAFVVYTSRWYSQNSAKRASPVAR